MGLTVGLLASVFLAVVVGLIWVGFPWRLVLGVATSVLFLQWVLADELVLTATGARVVTAEESPVLHGYIDRLCATANLAKPRIAIQQADFPNAFAAGVRRDHTMVCFSTGLLECLTPEEFEAVAAHELSHLAHRDALVMTLSSSGSVISGFLMKLSAVTAVGSAAAASVASEGRTRADKDSEGVALAFFLFAVSVLVVSSVVYAVTTVMLLALSRYRELAADRAAVLLTGNPHALASALTRISDGASAIPVDDLRAARGMSALSFTPAISPESSWGWLLSTHPTLQQRLDNIYAAARQLGGP